MSIWRPPFLQTSLAFALAWLFGGAAVARAQVLIKVNDENRLEVGYFIRDLKLTPVFQFTNRDLVHSIVGGETRWSIGVNYWWAGHNANIKTAYGRIDPQGLASQNEFTVQLQLFYF